jgi:hypothetical protein
MKAVFKVLFEFAKLIRQVKCAYIILICFVLLAAVVVILCRFTLSTFKSRQPK